MPLHSLLPSFFKSAVTGTTKPPTVSAPTSTKNKTGIMVMDPVEVSGDWAEPGVTTTTSTGLAVGSFFVPYWLLGVVGVTVAALGTSYLVGGKKRRKPSHRRTTKSMRAQRRRR